jgi:hypothetical protein
MVFSQKSEVERYEETLAAQNNLLPNVIARNRQIPLAR